MASTYRWQSKTLRSDPWIAGKRIGVGVGQITWQEPQGGAELVRMLAGNTIYQRRAGERFAPMMLSPWRDVEMQLDVIDEADFRHLQDIQGLEVPALIELVHVDRYYLIAEAHTDWVLSRVFPWALGTSTDYPVTVEVADIDDQSVADVLTLAASSPPSVGEYYIAETAGERTVETVDLSADAGRVLKISYTPIRRMVVEEVSSTVAGGDRHQALDVTVRMQEHLQDQAW